ncbi:hypothetical protein CN689_18650 [Peribacillus butanolivorans]|uniref:Uncharacterized protein n=1 Tax=Peribacillus butanolivorans TaxID=421767 RepID=A0AAX0RR70_9BACI|nr:hypothetical protein CN689_18650 [Peribacillus butanolivorans]
MSGRESAVPYTNADERPEEDKRIAPIPVFNCEDKGQDCCNHHDNRPGYIRYLKSFPANRGEIVRNVSDGCDAYPTIKWKKGIGRKRHAPLH